MSTGRSNLAQQGRDVAALFTGLKPIYERKNGFVKAKALVDERMTLTTTSVQNTRGQYSTFEIQRPADMVGEFYISYDRAAGTYTSGDVPSFEDWEGYSSIDRVVVKYGTKIVWEQKGQTMKRKMLSGQYKSNTATSDQDVQKEICGWAALQNGMLSLAERQSRFLKAQSDITVALMMPWRKINKRLPLQPLPNKLYVEVWWHTDQQCCRMPNIINLPVLGAITNLRLILDCTHLLEEDRDMIFDQIYSGQMPYEIKLTDHEYEQYVGFTGTVTANNNDASIIIPLRNIKSPAYALQVLLQYQDNVDKAQCLDRDRYLPIRSIVLRDQGKEVSVLDNGLAGTTYNNSSSLMLHHDNLVSFPYAPVGSLLYFIKFCPNEFFLTSDDHCFGARQISKYINPDIKVVYNSNIHSVVPFPDSAANQTPSATIDKTRIYATVISYAHQTIFMSQSDFRRFLSM